MPPFYLQDISTILHFEVIEGTQALVSMISGANAPPLRFIQKNSHNNWTTRSTIWNRRSRSIQELWAICEMGSLVYHLRWSKWASTKSKECLDGLGKPTKQWVSFLLLWTFTDLSAWFPRGFEAEAIRCAGCSLSEDSSRRIAQDDERKWETGEDTDDFYRCDDYFSRFYRIHDLKWKANRNSFLYLSWLHSSPSISLSFLETPLDIWI